MEHREGVARCGDVESPDHGRGAVDRHRRRNLAHGDAVAGEVGNLAFRKVLDCEIDLVLNTGVHALLLAEPMTTAFTVGDEFLEDLIHMGWSEDAEMLEFLHTLVGVDVGGAVGTHLDVRNPEFPTNTEDDAQQLVAVHPGCKMHRGARRTRWSARERWWRRILRNGGEHTHDASAVAGCGFSRRLIAYWAESRSLMANLERVRISSCRCEESLENDPSLMNPSSSVK